MNQIKTWITAGGFCLLLTGLSANPSRAQIETNLDRYTGKNAEGYIKPLVTALGTHLNRGWYRSARVSRSGFYLYLGAKAMTAFISDDDRTYTATTEGFFNPVQTA